MLPIALLICLVLATACTSEASPPATTAPTPPTTVVSTAGGTAPPTSLPATTTPATTTPSVSSTPDGQVRIEVIVVGGEVRSESRSEVPLGTLISLAVSSDVTDEVHVHTYDVVGEVQAGETAVLEFEATIPGIFEVELETSHLQILELVVQ